MRRYKSLGVTSVILCLLLSCNQSSSAFRSDTAISSDSLTLKMDTAAFRGEIDGKQVALYVLKNSNGTQAYFTNFGARVVGLWVKDNTDGYRDVILGFSKASDYNNPREPYFGPIVGPFGNRIAKGKFKIADTVYNLSINNGVNTLHGGFKGLHFANWDLIRSSDSELTFGYMHPDGEDGFPGNIKIEVTYSLNDSDELGIAYKAVTDKKTIINLTNHAYFNLNGEGSGSILNHGLQLFADRYTPVDSTLIPTGKIEGVKETPFDFSQLKLIGQDIDIPHQQLTYGKGYDHNFVLRQDMEGEYFKAARVEGDKSGIVMEILTKEPGIQFYSGNFMNKRVVLKNGVKDAFRTGFCLEPQHFPDSPNQVGFPSTFLSPGEEYNSKSIYRFTVIKN